MPIIRKPTGGSGALAIGNAIAGGFPLSVLFEDAAQNLAADIRFTFDPATGLLSVPNDIRFQKEQGSHSIAPQNSTTPTIDGDIMSIAGANGSPATAIDPGANGGELDLSGGNGGDGSVLQPAGNGSPVIATAGNAGADLGGGGASGGTYRIDAGARSGAGFDGLVQLGIITAEEVWLGRIGKRIRSFADGIIVRLLAVAPAPPVPATVIDYVRSLVGEPAPALKTNAGVEYRYSATILGQGLAFNRQFDPPITLYPVGITILATFVPVNLYRNFTPMRWSIPGKNGGSTTNPTIRFIWSDGSFTDRVNVLAPPLVEQADSFFWGKDGLTIVSIQYIANNVGILPDNVNISNYQTEGWQY